MSDPAVCMACAMYNHAQCLMRTYPGAKITLCGCWCLKPPEVAKKILEIVHSQSSKESARVREKYADVIEFLESEAKK